MNNMKLSEEISMQPGNQLTWNTKDWWAAKARKLEEENEQLKELNAIALVSNQSLLDEIEKQKGATHKYCLKVAEQELELNKLRGE